MERGKKEKNDGAVNSGKSLHKATDSDFPETCYHSRINREGDR